METNENTIAGIKSSNINNCPWFFQYQFGLLYFLQNDLKRTFIEHMPNMVAGLKF